MITDMRHDDIRSLLGAYALHAVDGTERSEIEAHLPACEECRREVDDHLTVAAMLAGVDESAPDDLWTRVESRLDLDGDGGHIARVVPLSRFRRTRMLAVSAGATAAVLALAVGLLGGRVGSLDTELVAARDRLDRLEAALDSGDYASLARTVSADPAASTVQLAGEAGIAVTIVLLPDGTGVVLSSTLSPLAPDRTYQLWAVQDGAIISAGLLGSDPGNVPFHVDPSLLEGLVITEERAGGVPVSDQPAIAAWFPEA